MKIKRDQKEKQLQIGGKYNECSARRMEKRRRVKGKI